MITLGMLVDEAIIDIYDVDYFYEENWVKHRGGDPLKDFLDYEVTSIYAGESEGTIALDLKKVRSANLG